MKVRKDRPIRLEHRVADRILRMSRAQERSPSEIVRSLLAQRHGASIGSVAAIASAHGVAESVAWKALLGAWDSLPMSEKLRWLGVAPPAVQEQDDDEVLANGIRPGERLRRML